MLSFDICWMQVSLENSIDIRPCLIIDPRTTTSGTIAAMPLSAQIDLYDPQKHFLIRSDHPDFQATGLRKTSYIIDRTADVPVARILPNPAGKLTGKLLAEFRDWSGF